MLKYLPFASITFIVGFIIVNIGVTVMAPNSPDNAWYGVVFAILYLCSVICVATQLILEKKKNR